MLTWFVRKRLASFERDLGYDMSYARDILAADPRAFFAFARDMSLSRYRKDVPRDVYWAAKLAGTIAEDCGPCTQLLVTMALRDRVPARVISAVLAGDDAALTEEVQLGLRFARAALAHDPAADVARDQIVARWGARALVSLAFAITSARIFPTVKYALGHGRACQRVLVAGEPIAVVRSAA
jgi:hypothetical protein